MPVAPIFEKMCRFEEVFQRHFDQWNLTRIADQQLQDRYFVSYQIQRHQDILHFVIVMVPDYDSYTFMGAATDAMVDLDGLKELPSVIRHFIRRYAESP